LQLLKWLPTAESNGSLSLKSSTECRSRRDKLLVNSQLPILETSISLDWQERLGWETTLPSPILISQIKWGIDANDSSIVNAVLTYVAQKGLIEQVANDLMKLSCVYTSSRVFVTPSQIFRPSRGSIAGYEGLHPYIFNVDRAFWERHEKVLTRIGVGDQVQPTDLIKLQTILEEKPQLEESDIDVAIEILRLAGKFPRDSLTGLKVIDKFGKFYPIHEISFDDLGVLKAKRKVNLAHPNIPFATIQKLGIGSLKEELIKGLLEIEDVDDEDEFDQRENITTRIADTLDRYPVETTFREYLANADDAKDASKVSWLLDLQSHAQKELLTPELSSLQGPSFLVYNDGGR
jgi:sacsin